MMLKTGDSESAPLTGGSALGSSRGVALAYGAAGGEAPTKASASLPGVVAGDRGSMFSSSRCCSCLPCCASLPLRGRWLLSILISTLLIVAAGAGAVFVAPAFVRNRIEATTLSFTSIELSAPTWPSESDLVDGSGAGFGFTITAMAVLSGLSPFGGTLEAMPVDLLFEGVALASFTLPSVTAAPYVDNALALTARVVITDIAAFNRFGVALLQNEAVDFTLLGSATVSAGPIRISDVPFRKGVTVAGARNLTDNYVESFSLAQSTPTSAIVNLTVVAINPSVAAIAPLGDLAVDVFYSGVYFGTVIAPNASLVPGANRLTFVGALASDDLALTNQLISSYLSGSAVNVTAVGSTRVMPTIPLYAALLRAVTIDAQLQGGDVPLVSSVDVHTMSLMPTGNTTVRVKLNATILVNNILGPNSPLDITSVRINVTLLGGGVPLGRLVVDMPNLQQDAANAAGGKRLRAREPRSRWRPLARRGLAAAASDPLPALAIPLLLDAELDISSTADGFDKFVLAFVANETVNLGLYSPLATGLEANITSALGNLSIGIPLNIVTPVAGLAGLPFVTVDDFAVTGQVLVPAAILVSLNVTIYNPSPASFSLGELSKLGIYSGGVRLGSSTAVNSTLVPGYNRLSLEGRLVPPSSALPAASALFSDYLNGVDVVATVRGEDVVVGGGLPTPTWLLDAVRSITLSATLPAPVGLTVFDEVSLQSLDLAWAPPPGDASGEPIPYIAGTVAGNLHLPFSIDVDIPSYSLVLVFNDPATGTPMASIALDDQAADFAPSLPVGGLGRGRGVGPNRYPVIGRLTLFLSRAPLDVLDADAFSRFITSVLLQPTAAVRLSGTAAPVVRIAIGSLNITGVRIAENLTLPGINGLSDPPPAVLNVDVVETAPSAVTLAVKLNVTNPSILAGSLGPVKLALVYDSAVVATADVANLTVARGENIVSALALFVLPDRAVDPVGYARKATFLGDFLSGVDATLRLVGGEAPASPYPLLAPAIAALNTSCPFPGLPSRVVINGTLYIDLGDPGNIPPKPNGTLFLDNPLSAAITLVDSNLTVFLCNDPDIASGSCKNGQVYNNPIGFFYDGDLSLRPAVAPAAQVSRSGVYPILLLASDADKVTIFFQLAFNKMLITKMNGTVGVLVGEFRIDLPLTQYGMPLFAAPPADTPPMSAASVHGTTEMR